ncbi:hypothetical protein [Lysobacter gummosus]|uniref:hypothetical protein n=1 Tax=Lysobacter gummosus TaxID=262324 RepID=UPI00363401BC
MRPPRSTRRETGSNSAERKTFGGARGYRLAPGVIRGAAAGAGPGPPPFCCLQSGRSYIATRRHAVPATPITAGPPRDSCRSSERRCWQVPVPSSIFLKN